MTLFKLEIHIFKLGFILTQKLLNYFLINLINCRLDDASFRRGNFKRHQNLQHNATVSDSKEKNLTNDGIIFNPNVPPPPFSVNTKFEDIKPPLDPEIIDVTEFTCTPEYYEEDDVEQKYQSEKIVETIFSRRLRKKLEEEEIQRKNLEKEEAERKILEEEQKIFENKEAEQKVKEEPNNEQKAIIDGTAEKTKNAKFGLNEETGRNLQQCVSEKEEESSSKCTLDNKENLSCSNHLNVKLEYSLSQSKSPSLNALEEDLTRHRPVLVNKLLTKRSRHDSEEEVEVKRPKIEGCKSHLTEPPVIDPLRGHDDFREDWGDNYEAENVKDTRSERDFNQKTENKLERLNGCINEDYGNKKNGKKDDPKHDYLISRLYLLAGDSAYDSLRQERRRDLRNDLDKMKENAKSRSRDKYAKDKYRDNFEKERYEKDRYSEKIGKERYRRDKYDEEKSEADRYKREREKDRHVREKYDREKFEKEKPDRKKFRRSRSLSPERLNRKNIDERIIRRTNVMYNDAKNNLDRRRNQKNITFYENEQQREKFRRPNVEESKTILENFKSRRERGLRKRDSSERSRSSSYEKDKRETRKGSSTNERSRSESKDNDCIINPDRKNITENSEDCKENQLMKGNLSKRSRSNSKDKGKDRKLEEEDKHILEIEKARLERELRKCDLSERSRSKSKDKDCRNENFKDLPSKIKTYGEDNVKMDLGTENVKLPIILEKSTNDNDLEEGEILDTSILIPSCVSNFEQNKEKSKSLGSKTFENFSGYTPLDIFKRKVEDSGNGLEKIAPDKVKFVNLKVENGSIKDKSKDKELKETVQSSKEVQNQISHTLPENEVQVTDGVEKIENLEENLSKKNEDNSVTDDGVKKVENVERSEKNTVEETHPVSKKKTTLESQSENEKQKIDVETSEKDKCNMEPDLVLNNPKVYDKNDLEKYGNNIETTKTAKEFSEDNKNEVNLAELERLTRGNSSEKNKLKGEIENKMKGIAQNEVKETENIIKIKSPLKKQKLIKSKKESSNPIKEKKKQKRAKSQEIDEKTLNTVKEKEIKVKEKDNMKNNIPSPVKELNRSQSREKEETLSEMLNSLENEKKQKEKKLNEAENVLSNTSSSVKDRRKQIQLKETQQKSIEKPSKVKEVKPKESKKQVQSKIKQEVIPEKKSKDKKIEEKADKKIVIIVRRKRRIPILSDSNASTTIVSSQNIITNIKSNNVDKNLLS